MSRDFYFKPDNIRICTDYRDKKEKWYLQININNAGITIPIRKNQKERIIRFVSIGNWDRVLKEITNAEYKGLNKK